jgi:hypothetical protein
MDDKVTVIDWTLWRTALTDVLFWITVMYVGLAIVFAWKALAGTGYLGIVSAVAGACGCVFGYMFFMNTPMVTIYSADAYEDLMNGEFTLDDVSS